MTQHRGMKAYKGNVVQETLDDEQRKQRLEAKVAALSRMVDNKDAKIAQLQRTLKGYTTQVDIIREAIQEGPSEETLHRISGACDAMIAIRVTSKHKHPHPWKQ